MHLNASILFFVTKYFYTVVLLLLHKCMIRVLLPLHTIKRLKYILKFFVVLCVTFTIAPQRSAHADRHSPGRADSGSHKWPPGSRRSPWAWRKLRRQSRCSRRPLQRWSRLCGRKPHVISTSISSGETSAVQQLTCVTQLSIVTLPPSFCSITLRIRTKPIRKIDPWTLTSGMRTT